MTQSFLLRAGERGHSHISSVGHDADYVSGHPESFITRESSFNFHEYQQGRPGFGRVRVFGDEVFTGLGCGYNMHPHHNFAISAIVLDGELTHINTTGKLDVLHRDEFYIFGAGSGGKHAELNIGGEPMNAIYVWFLPGRLMAPPSYHRTQFDRARSRNAIVEMIGTAEGALPIDQDARVSRLVTDRPGHFEYRLRSRAHGIYAFVVDGKAVCAGERLGRRDSLGLWGAEALQIETSGTADLLLVETIM